MPTLENIDRTQLKNATIERTSENLGAIGFHETIPVKDNYLLIKATNYSSIGYVFGLAQYNTTLITTSASPSTSIHTLSWSQLVRFKGNEQDLIAESNNVTITNGYENLQFTSTGNGAYFKHLLLYNPYNFTDKYFKFTLTATPTTNEKYNYQLGGVASNNFLTNYFDFIDEQEFIFLAKQPPSNLYLKLLRDDNNSTANETQSIQEIRIETINSPEYKTKLSNSNSIDYTQSTGTFNNGWSGNTDDEIVSKVVCISGDTAIKSFTIDLSSIDHNLNFINGLDKLYYSEDGQDWTLADMTSYTKQFTQISEKGFNYVFNFPFTNAFKSFYFKIIAGEDNKYIDTTNGYFIIRFELA